MGRGRPRKPTATLKLMGAFRNNRHAERENEPQPTGTPVAPAWLDETGLELWNRLVPKLIAIGVAKDFDNESLGSMCRWWSAWRKADAALVENGITTAGMNQSVAAWKQFSLLASKFGLTPVDRTKIAVEPKDDNQDTEKRYFA